MENVKTKILFGDSKKVLNMIESNSIDLIVTSPPYNVDIKYNSNNDHLSYEEYLEFIVFIRGYAS